MYFQAKSQDQDFKFGDLLQSINRSHEQLQSQLMQGGLSPITPAEPVPKPWPHHQPPGVRHSDGSQVSHGLLKQVQSRDERGSGLLTEVIGAGGLLAAARNIQYSSAASTVISHPPATGFTPVVLPSQSHTARSSGHNMPVASSFVSLTRPTVTTTQIAMTKDIKTEPEFAPSSLSVTQPGPPNVTISTRTTMPSQDKQRLPRNPFTFPATPPVSLTNDRPPFQINQSTLVATDGVTNDKQRHASDDMPQLSPVGKVKKVKEEASNEELVTMVSVASYLDTC